MTLVSTLPVARRPLSGDHDTHVIFAEWYCQSFWLTCMTRHATAMAAATVMVIPMALRRL